MFKQIPFGDGNYYINENGEIFNTKRNRYLTVSIGNHGYPVVKLSHNGFSQRFLLHRLVAQAFIPNPHNLPVVMHLNNNILDYRLSNLKWGTSGENQRQAYADGLRQPTRQFYIWQIFNPTSPVLIECVGAKELAKRIGYKYSSIDKVYTMGGNITMGPYKGWKFIKDRRSETIP